MRNFDRIIAVRIAIAAILIAVYAYLSAFYLGAGFRFGENIVTAILAVYCAYRLLKDDHSAFGWIMFSAFVGIGINAVIEASLYLFATVDVGNWYSFGNHIRNIPVILMTLLLSGLMADFSNWLENWLERMNGNE